MELMLLKKTFLLLLFATLVTSSQINSTEFTKVNGRLQISFLRQIEAGSGIFEDYKVIDNKVYLLDNPEPIALSTDQTALVCFSFVHDWLMKKYPALADSIDKNPRCENKSSLSPFSNPFIHKFTSDFMVETDNPKTDDVVLYYSIYDGRTRYNHIGIMTSESEVMSKWGLAFKNVFIHRISSVPINYGPYVKFYTLREYK